MTAHDPKALVPAAAARVAPFLAPLQREFDRMLSEFGQFDFDMFGPTPRMNLSEDEDGMELTLEAPGYAPAQVKIEIQDDVLTIRGEARQASDKTEKNLRVSERRYGAFSRSVRLPESIDSERLTASMKDGLLTVTAPRAKSRPMRKTTIAIKAG